MAKFRRAHTDKSSNRSGMIVKVGLFSAIIGGLFFLFNKFTGSELSLDKDAPEAKDYADEYFFPTSTTGEIIHHKYYSISYSEEHEQAEWVAHILKKEDLVKPWNDRRDNFRPDPKVSKGSAELEDYRNSGYDRGHLVPSADMAHNKEAMSETFYMSNMSPQSRNFNKGIWRELEELTRGWAKKFEKLYVVTGPVLTEEPKGYIGDNEVSVPVAFYKVLLDITDPELKGIGFIIPNQVLFEPLYEFACTIDEVEQMTGLDFFHELLEDELEEEVEGEFNLDLWEFNKSKYEDRINNWNRQ